MDQQQYLERIRSLAQGSCWNVSDLDIAWHHMREIEDMSFDRFALFAIDCQKLSVINIVGICQAIQKAVTGQVMRTTLGG